MKWLSFVEPVALGLFFFSGLVLLVLAGLFLRAYRGSQSRKHRLAVAARVHELLAAIGDPSTPFLAKIAAAHELRFYRSQRELIFSACGYLRFQEDDRPGQLVREMIEESLDILSKSRRRRQDDL